LVLPLIVVVVGQQVCNGASWKPRAADAQLHTQQYVNVLAQKLWLITPAQRGQPPFTMPLRRQGSDATSVMSGMTNMTGVDRRLPVREQLRAPINLASLSGCAHMPGPE